MIVMHLFYFWLYGSVGKDLCRRGIPFECLKGRTCLKGTVKCRILRLKLNILAYRGAIGVEKKNSEF